jgi:membrane protein required for colicin V production
MPITILDLVLLGVMLIRGCSPWVRGFIARNPVDRGMGPAALVTLYAFSKLLPYCQDLFGSDTIARVVVVPALFIGTLICGVRHHSAISDMILDSRIGALDRTLGFLFGLGRGLLIVVVALHVLQLAVPGQAAAGLDHRGKSRMVLQGTGDWLMSLLPETPRTPS